MASPGLDKLAAFYESEVLLCLMFSIFEAIFE